MSKHRYTPLYPALDNSICRCGLAKTYCELITEASMRSFWTRLTDAWRAGWKAAKVEFNYGRRER